MNVFDSPKVGPLTALLSDEFLGYESLFETRVGEVWQRTVAQHSPQTEPGTRADYEFGCLTPSGIFNARTLAPYSLPQPQRSI